MTQRVDNMSLPKGRTCGDCNHFYRCSYLIGAASSNTRCDWAPSRFSLSRDAIRNEALEEAKKAIPTNWLDPLMTGPESVIGSYPFKGTDIEAVLYATMQRIESLKRPQNKDEVKG